MTRREFLAFLLASPHLTVGTLPQDLEVYVLSLEQSALAGDRSAIRTLFQLRPQADGAAAEYINIVLGQTIENDATVFLEELQRTPRTFKLSGLLGNLGPDYVDEFERQAKELRKRMNALECVKAESLASVKEECLAALGKSAQRNVFLKGLA